MASSSNKHEKNNLDRRDGPADRLQAQDTGREKTSMLGTDPDSRTLSQSAGILDGKQTSDWREEVGLPQAAPFRGERRGHARVQGMRA